MNKIIFPSFNLEFQISPIVIEFGNVQIYWYAIAIVSGIVISLFLTYYAKNKYNIKYDDFLEIMIFVLVFGIMGARGFYVLFNLNYYLSEPLQIFNIRNGGLAIYGGIIVGAITAYFICKKKKIKFLNLCDFTVPYLVLTQGIGRLGNFINMEAYGVETTSFLRMGILTDIGYKEVHPCFLYEMLGCFIIFTILKLCQKNQKFSGEILSVYLILYGFIRFLIEGLRADSLMIYNLKISQIISVLFVVFGIIIYIKNKVCRKKENKVDGKKDKVF